MKSEAIASLISNWTGVPVNQLTEEETERLLKMEETLARRVIGQEEADKVDSEIHKERKGGTERSEASHRFLPFHGAVGGR